MSAARGRPKGSPNVDQVVTLEASRCPKCGSTRRSEYLDRTVQEYEGLTSDGRPYNRIVRRRTRCLDCEQLRIDRTLEFEPPAAPSAK
jgi:hypothetical protein